MSVLTIYCVIDLYLLIGVLIWIKMVLITKHYISPKRILTSFIWCICLWLPELIAIALEPIFIKEENK